MSFLVVVAAAMVLGLSVLRRWLRETRADAYVVALFAGVGLLAVVCVLLGSASLQWAQFAVVVLAVAGLAYTFRARQKRAGEQSEPASRPPFNGVEKICVAAVIGSFLISLITALAPNTSWDDTVAHLALAQAYARENRILFLEGSTYSAYPQLLHSLYAVCFNLGGELSVSLFNWFMSVAATAAIFCLGRTQGTRQTGLVASAIFATAPIYLDQAGTARIDVAFAGFVVAALLCFVHWVRTREIHWLICCAFIVGSAWGVRHTAYLVTALLGVAVLFAPTERRFLKTALYSVVAVGAAAPWLIRSYLVVRNPFHPFFGSALMPDAHADVLAQHESVVSTGLTGLIMFPWDIVMKPMLFDGWSASPGPLVLLLGIPGIVLGGRSVRLLGVFALAGLVAFFFFRQHARYILPFFAPMMVVAAAAVDKLPRIRKPLAGLLAFSFAYGLLIGVAMVHFKIPVALGFQDRLNYYGERIERYPAFEWINQNLADTLGPGERVLTLDPRSYFLKVRAYSTYEALPRIRDLPMEDQVAWLRSRGIKYIFYPVAYIEESPGFVERGYPEHVNWWFDDPRYFRRVRQFNLPRPRSDHYERVELFEVLDPDSP